MNLLDEYRQLCNKATLESLALFNKLVEKKYVCDRLISLKQWHQESFEHSLRVFDNTFILAEEAWVTPQSVDMTLLCEAALLHDIGKLCVAKDILDKPGKFTSAEYDVMKTHAYMGAIYLMGVAPPLTVRMVHEHHERIDGSGYPRGLVGNEILTGSRIIAVADVFDALTMDRCYHLGKDKEVVIERLVKDASLDMNVIRTLKDSISR